MRFLFFLTPLSFLFSLLNVFCINSWTRLLSLFHCSQEDLLVMAVCPSASKVNSLALTQRQNSSVQLLNHVQLFTTPWTAAHQASLSITNSQSLFKLMSIASVMPSNHLILCHPLLLLPSIFPSIRIFSNESILCIRWLKYWSFRFNEWIWIL